MPFQAVIPDSERQRRRLPEMILRYVRWRRELNSHARHTSFRIRCMPETR